MTEIERAIERISLYEESRLAFFEQQLAGANRKLDWAIEHNKSHWDCAEKGEIVSFYQDIVEMLREQAERGNGCVFCNDERHRIREVFDEGTAKIIDAENRYALSVDTSRDAAIFNIFYCPMCGRRLEAQHE